MRCPTGRVNDIWTAERIQQLTLLATEGMSSSQIARIMRITRNAVIGKLRRIGVDLGRPHGVKDLPEPSVKPRREFKPRLVAPKPAPPPEPVEVEAPPTGGIPLEDTGSSHCRWPTWGDNGGGPLYLVCGARTTVIGASWCPGHAEQVQGRGTYPERKAASHAASIAKAETQVEEAA